MSDITGVYDSIQDAVPEPEIRHQPTLDDIREWGRQQGRNVPERGRLPKGLREDFQRAMGGEDATPVARVEEVAPRTRAESPAKKARGFFSSKPKTGRPARQKHPRVSIEDLISGGWWLLSQAAKPVSRPMSRAIAMEAPVAGMILDETLRGTLADRVLQPLARTESSSKTVAALMMPPLLVGMIDRFPDRGQVLVPLLRKSLQLHMDIAGPKMEELIRREQEFEAKYGESVDQMIISFFVDPEEEAGEQS